MIEEAFSELEYFGKVSDGRANLASMLFYVRLEKLSWPLLGPDPKSGKLKVLCWRP